MAILKDLKAVKVNFNLRQLKNSNEVTGVNCIIRWNKLRLVLTSVERIKPKEWNEENQKATNKFLGYSEFNERLRSIKNSIENSYRAYLNDNKQYPSLEDFRAIAKKAVNIKATSTIESHSRNVITFLEHFIVDCETGVRTSKGSPMSPNSIKRYRALKGNLLEFLSTKKTRELTFDNISVALIQEFKRFLIITKEYTPGTVDTRLTGLNTLLNWATRLGVNSKLEYKESGLNETVPQSFEIYLNLDELEKIQKLELSGNPRLDKVRDLFLLGCWTSLRFSDLFQISERLIETDKEGEKYLRITPKKTNKELIIPILAISQKILEKYTLPDNTIELPNISNQKFNQYIKELGKLAEINEETTFIVIKGGKKETGKLLSMS